MTDAAGVAKVNCTAPEEAALCQQRFGFAVTGFPTLLLLAEGRALRFPAETFDRTQPQIERWLHARLEELAEYRAERKMGNPHVAPGVEAPQPLNWRRTADAAGEL